MKIRLLKDTPALGLSKDTIGEDARVHCPKTMTMRLVKFTGLDRPVYFFDHEIEEVKE